MNLSGKKKNLLKKVPNMLKGSLTHSRRKCGNPNCKKCKSGEKHPLSVFTFYVNEKKTVVNVPKNYIKPVQKLVDNWHHHKDLIEKLTDINIKLMRKGKLKE